MTSLSPDTRRASRGVTRPGLALGVLLTGQFMALVDVGMMNVAVPTIQSDLAASGAALQLVVSGYTTGYAVLLITGARLGERLGFHGSVRVGGRPVFLVNVPIGGVLLLVFGSRLLPASRGVARPLDLPGLVTLELAVGLLVVPLVLGHEEGWPWWTAAMLAGSAVALAGFGMVEARIGARRLRRRLAGDRAGPVQRASDEPVAGVPDGRAGPDRRVGLRAGVRLGPLSRGGVRAADASGVIVTVIQLGTVVGVAAIGSVFLDALLAVPLPASSGRAAELACYAVAAVTLVATAATSCRRPVTHARPASHA